MILQYTPKKQTKKTKKHEYTQFYEERGEESANFFFFLLFSFFGRMCAAFISDENSNLSR